MIPGHRYGLFAVSCGNGSEIEKFIRNGIVDIHGRYTVFLAIAISRLSPEKEGYIEAQTNSGGQQMHLRHTKDTGQQPLCRRTAIGRACMSLLATIAPLPAVAAVSGAAIAGCLVPARKFFRM